MRVVFQKRRYYQGKLREIGDRVDMDNKHFKIFYEVRAVIPEILTAAPTEVAGQRPRRTRTPKGT